MNQDAFIKISHLNSAFLWTNSEYNQNKIFRGGSWYDSLSQCELKEWTHSEPGFWYIYVGFRIARSK